MLELPLVVVLVQAVELALVAWSAFVVVVAVVALDLVVVHPDFLRRVDFVVSPMGVVFVLVAVV